MTFQALYGVDDTGDACNPENIKDFTERVKNETDGKGVYFMMSDGVSISVIYLFTDFVVFFL